MTNAPSTPARLVFLLPLISIKNNGAPYYDADTLIPGYLGGGVE